MENKLLLPHICRVIGLILFIPSVVLCVANFNYDFQFSFLNTPKPVVPANMDFNDYNLTNEFAISGVIISLFMIAFSRLKAEDEYVKHIRLQSLQAGVYVNYFIFVILTFAVHGLNYLMILEFNTATILIFFILAFNFSLYIKPRFSKSVTI